MFIIYCFLTFLILVHSASTSTEETKRPMDAMADITNDLGIRILQLLSSMKEGSNVAFSPYGLASVSMLLFEGSQGGTALQLFKTLNLPWNTYAARIGFRDLNRHLKMYFRSDGFLDGLVFSRPDVCLYPSFQKLLRFYGVDEPSNAVTYPCFGFTPWPTTPYYLPTPTAIVPNSTTATTVSMLTQPSNNIVTEYTQTSQTILVRKPGDMKTAGTSSEDSYATTTEMNFVSGEEATVDHYDAKVTTVLAKMAAPTNFVTAIPGSWELTETTTAAVAIAIEESTTLVDNASESGMMTVVTVEETTIGIEGTTILDAENAANSPIVTTDREETTTTEILAALETKTDAGDVTKESISAGNPTAAVEITPLQLQSSRVVSNYANGTKEEKRNEASVTAISGNLDEFFHPNAPLFNISKEVDLPDIKFEIEVTSPMLDPEFSNDNSTEYFFNFSRELDPNLTNFSFSYENEDKFGNFSSEKAFRDNLDSFFNGSRRNLSGEDLIPKNASSYGFPDDVLTPKVSRESDPPAPPFSTNKTDKANYVKIISLKDVKIVQTNITKRNKGREGLVHGVDCEVILRGNNVDLDALKAKRVGLKCIKDVPRKKVKGKKVQNVENYTKIPISFKSNEEYASRRRRSFYQNSDWFLTYASSNRILVPTFWYSAILPYAFAPSLNSHILELPLDDDRYSLVVLIPNNQYGLYQLLAVLSRHSMRWIYSQLRLEAVYATIPIFGVLSRVDLKAPFYQLGVADLFHAHLSDLSIMSPDRNLHVRHIQQVVTIYANKYPKSVYQTPPQITEHYVSATHPFAYFVIDKATKAMLVAGIMTDPLKQTVI